MTLQNWARVVPVVGAISCAAAAAAASPLPTLPSYGLPGGSNIYPGPRFDWPAPVTGYFWFVDITSVARVPTPVADFTVTNTTVAPLPVMTFQAFGNCDFVDPAWKPDFTLFIDGTRTPWTAVESAPCGYHDFLDFVLPVGPTRFTVQLDALPDASARYVDMRFGNVIPAIPLPPAAVLLPGGVLALGLFRRRRSS